MSFIEVERGFLALFPKPGPTDKTKQRPPRPKFNFLMGPHATPVGIKTRGQDDIMFNCTQIFHLFYKISGNSWGHFLQPS